MLRHGQTEYNAGSRMQGQLDTDLTDLGRDQAVAAAEVLAKRQPLVIVSSDLRRALDTAVCLGERSGMPVRGRHPVAGDTSRRLAGEDARSIQIARRTHLQEGTRRKMWWASGRTIIGMERWKAKCIIMTKPSHEMCGIH